jgi:hypothetical protein
MSNISIAGASSIFQITLPSSSTPLGGDLYIDDFTGLYYLKDSSGNEIRSISGFGSSNLLYFEFEGSNARLSGNFVSVLPSNLVSFKLDSDLSTISGSLPSSWSSVLDVFSLTGNNNTISGRIPTTLPTNVQTIRIQGNKINFTGGSASDSFLPASIPASVYNFLVSNESGNTGTHEGTLPTFILTSNLSKFNVVGMKLHGDLPTQLPYNITRFKIGGRSSNGTYHAGLSSSQAFPICSPPSPRTGVLEELAMTNLKNGIIIPKITSCASNVFERCSFSNNTLIDLRYNAFSSSTTNQVLVAITNAAGSSNGILSRVIKMQGNRPPSDLISMSATSGGNANTGNTAINYLLDNNWSIQFSTNSDWQASNWPA